MKITVSRVDIDVAHRVGKIDANHIWGNCAKTHLWRIFKQQKLAIRLISNNRKRDSTTNSFHELNIAKLPDLYQFNILMFMYKFMNHKLPSVFDNFLYRNNFLYHGTI